MEFDRDYKMLIDGKLVAAADDMDVVNPATGKAFTKSPRASESDLNAAVEAAQKAFKSWKNTPIDERPIQCQPDKTFSGKTNKHRAIKDVQLIDMMNDIKILLNGLRKSDTRIQPDA